MKPRIRILFWDWDGVGNSLASAVENRLREVRSSAKYQKRLKKNKNLKYPDKDYYRIMTGRREISNLNYLMKEMPDLRIVVSSTWRKNRTLEQLRQIFKIAGFKYPARVIDSTPVIYVDSGPIQKPYKPGDKPHQPCKQVRRGLEIAAWLDVAYTDKQHRVTDFVIVDDDSDMVFLKHRFVQTTADDGLTMGKVHEIMELFGEFREKDLMEDLRK